MYKNRANKTSIKNRLYGLMVTAMLVAGNAFAEDESADYEPDRECTIVGFLRDMWELLISMI